MENRKPFDLVIFDCDGVLVDSERITNTVLAEMMNDLGLRVTLADLFRDFVGNSMTVCMELIEQRLGRPVPEDFLARYRERSHAALAAHVRPVRGIEAALDALQSPYCVASSGDHEKMRLTLGNTNLLRRFGGKLFSVADVPRPKPYPDVFLHAAAHMGARPEHCAVIEDTERGVQAGIAAGMAVFGYAELGDPAKLADSGAVVFRSMEELPELLRKHARLAGR